jgi:iron complex transport system substrate-binding protein
MLNNNKIILLLLLISFILPISCKKNNNKKNKIKITDALKREVEIPDKTQHIICSGAGCLRLITYLEAEDMVIAVDDVEKRKNIFDARPYALANPQFKNFPLFGEFRGHDNPELILALDPLPDVIFKTYSQSGYDPIELQNKTGIPVIILKYGDLGSNIEDFYNALKIMGKILNKEKRADNIISFFNDCINDLNERTKNITDNKKKSCFVGGIAYRGPHGLQSTEPAYPPFKMVNADNKAYDKTKSPKELTHADVAKEKIIEWDPEIIFIDLSTLQLDIKANALYEIKNDPVYKELGAVKNGNIYGLLPYNWYTGNFGSIIADAYYIGKILYPDSFKDIEPEKKADEIYTFLVKKPVFKKMNEDFNNLAFKKISLK